VKNKVGLNPLAYIDFVIIHAVASYNYSLTGGQRTTYNQNGMQSIKVNSGWVEEDFKDNLKQLMLSEKVLVDEKPAILKTKSIELNKSINTKQINYSLEFEFAYDLINSIV